MSINRQPDATPVPPPEDMPEFYMIQRLKPFRVAMAPGIRFGQVFELEYMGASEYEAGYFSKYMRAAHARRDHLIEVNASIVYDVEKGLSYPITCFYDPGAMTWEHIEQQLTLVAQHKQQTRMGSRFPALPTQRTIPGKGRAKPKVVEVLPETCAWVDIGAQVFWAACDITLEQYKSLLQASVEYMDAEKALN